mgnify:FL=1
MDINQAQYVVSGGTFLAVATYGIRFIWKLQVSGENIYERRSDRQVATIKDLEEHDRIMREEMAKCYDERLALSEMVSNQKVELAAQKIKLAALEAEIKLLSHVPAVAVVPQVAENVTTIKERQTGQIIQNKEDASNVNNKLDEVLDIIHNQEPTDI